MAFLGTAPLAPKLSCNDQYLMPVVTLVGRFEVRDELGTTCSRSLLTRASQMSVRIRGVVP